MVKNGRIATTAWFDLLEQAKLVGRRPPKGLQRWAAVRYEVAVATNLAFHARGDFAPPLHDLPQAETVAIWFEGRRFVWHAVPPLDLGPGPGKGVLARARGRLADALQHIARKLETVHRQERGPTVSTPIDDMDDYEAERLATARLLSAIAYETREAVEVQSGGGLADSGGRGAAR